MDPLSMIAAAGITAAGSIGGGMLSNSATAQQQASANYINSQEFLNSAQIQQSEFQSAQQYNDAEAKQARAAAQDFASAQAQTNRDYQTQMSNTAYQRAVAGMKAAGLNPILSAGTGGASTPPGAMASAPGSQASSPGPGSVSGNTAGAAVMRDVISPGVHSALDALNTMADYNLKAKQADGSLSQIHVGPTGVTGTPEGIKKGLVTITRDLPSAAKGVADKIDEYGKPVSDTLNGIQDMGAKLHTKIAPYVDSWFHRIGNALDSIPTANPGSESKGSVSRPAASAVDANTQKSNMSLPTVTGNYGDNSWGNSGPDKLIARGLFRQKGLFNN